MAEKDACSPSPVRTPKLQLTAEQPLTGECWISPKKDMPRPRANKKPQQDGRRGEMTLESNLIPNRDAQRAQTYLGHTGTQRLQRD